MKLSFYTKLFYQFHCTLSVSTDLSLRILVAEFDVDNSDMADVVIKMSKNIRNDLKPYCKINICYNIYLDRLLQFFKQ